MRLVLAVTALLVLAGVAPGVVAAEPTSVDHAATLAGDSPSVDSSAVSAANVTVSGTVTYLNGSAATDATVLVGSRALFENRSQAELREIAAENPQNVTVTTADEQGNYSLTVNTDEVDAEAIVALTPDGISRVQSFSAGTVDLTVRTTASLAFDVAPVETEPGGRAQVTFAFTNTGDTAVEGLRLTLGRLPDGWNVAQTQSASATYSEANRTFTWGTVEPGERVTAEMKLFVAIDAETDTYQLPLFAGSRTHPIESGDLTVTVAFPTERNGDGGSGADSGISAPGFGPVVAVVAVLSGALALARRD